MATYFSTLTWRTPWIVACQASLSVGFSRQEYWSGLPFPPPGALPDPGIKPASPASSELAGRVFTTVPPGKSNIFIYLFGCASLSSGMRHL